MQSLRLQWREQTVEGKGKGRQEFYKAVFIVIQARDDAGLDQYESSRGQRNNQALDIFWR